MDPNRDKINPKEKLAGLPLEEGIADHGEERQSEASSPEMTRMPDAEALIIQDGILKSVNQTVARALGYSVEELVGESFKIILAPESVDRIKEGLLRQTEVDNISPAFRLALRARDGKVVPLHTEPSLTEFEGRAAVKIRAVPISTSREDCVGSLSPEAEVDKEEVQIPDEGIRAATTLSGMGFGVTIVQSDHTVKYQNQFLFERLGNLTGAKCYQECLNLSQPCEQCPFSEIKHTGSTKSAEIKAKDGRWYELVSSPGLNSDGSTYVLEMWIDVSEKKKIQEKVSFLSGLVNHTPESVIATDQDGRIIFVNPATERMFGYTNRELFGKDLEMLTTELYKERIQKEIFQAAVCGKVWHGELLNRRKDGRLFYVSTSVSKMVSREGDFIALVWFQRDISQSKRYQEEMIRIEKEKAETLRILHENETAINRSLNRAKRELQEKNLELEEEKKRLKEAYEKLNQVQAQLLQSEKLASLGQLSAGVAHELNNPISFVHSNLGTLGEYLQDIKALLNGYAELERALPADGSWGKSLEQINALKGQIDFDSMLQDFDKIISESKDGTMRVRNIVQNLKDFSYMDKGEPGLADINQGIESTLNIVWNEIKYKAEVTKEYGPIPKIECFPQQLNQVFMNILVNAAQAIQNHGEIAIRTYQKEENVVVEISDTGAGISEANLKHIFEPFFTTKEVGKGTGLGLSVVYGIVQKHKGKIEVESQVGKGSTFRVILPVKSAGEEQDDAEKSKMVEIAG
ncbi:MAG: PAS domain S-box protein [Candidatus Zixiibacteriota bacterium]